MNHKFQLRVGLILSFVFIITVNSSSACTIFTVSDQNNVFFGNNEDSTNPNTYIWFEQQNSTELGACYLGFDNFIPQGGLNEKGLAFDTNSVPSLPVTPRYPQVTQNEWAVTYLMKHCSNVGEVIDTIPKLYWGTDMGYQVHFADATGKAIVIHPGTNHEPNITRLDNTTNYLVSTNYNLGNHMGSYPCQRYDTATQLISSEVADNGIISVDDCFNFLNATHVETAFVNTLYSNVFDLKIRSIYLTYWHQYTEIINLNLTEELALGNHEYLIKSLFSEEIQEKAQLEYESYQSAYSESLKINSSSLPSGSFIIMALLPLVIFSVIWIKRRK